MSLFKIFEMFYAFLCILCILIQGTMVEQLCLNGLPCINIFVIKKIKKTMLVKVAPWIMMRDVSQNIVRNIAVFCERLDGSGHIVNMLYGTSLGRRTQGPASI